MNNKGRLIATSFIAGAAAALYASKKMQVGTLTNSSNENNSVGSYSKAKVQTPNTNPTTAETNNFYTKAPNIGTNNNSEVKSTAQTSNNIYFENIPNSESIGNAFTNKSENNTTTPITALKIDSW